MSVDRHTRHTRWPHVYAIGDVVSIPLAVGKPLPKAGVFAHKEAKVVAENIAHDIVGGPSTRDSMDMASASSKSAAAKRASAAVTSMRSRSQR